ncbi:MAG: glycerate kinase [Pseudomonadota bacterium]|nr:glycerate kinase [Pseudomonadota bacterium]
MTISVRNDPNQLMRALFCAAVASADPERLMDRSLIPDRPAGRTVVVGAGKAAASMAQALEACCPGPLSGVVLTPYGHAKTCSGIEVLEAAHPIPDRAGLRTADRILDIAVSLNEGDLMLCLLSGGGSSLLTLPIEELSLTEKQQINRQLLESGADISQINCVRKHLSRIKGGRLAEAAWPGSTFTLMISDVPDDNPAVIASGPTVADHSSCADALLIIDHYGIELNTRIRSLLSDGSLETPKPGAAKLARSGHRIIGSPELGLSAAAVYGREKGFVIHSLGSQVVGESRQVGVEHALMLQAMIKTNTNNSPLLLLSGGETTVTVRGSGRGGPNREYLLAAAQTLNGLPGAWGIACDTDGIDGSPDAAGAVIGPDTLAHAAALGLDAKTMLSKNDTGTFFSVLGDAVVTGPTCTNINDFRALLYVPPT